MTTTFGTVSKPKKRWLTQERRLALIGMSFFIPALCVFAVFQFYPIAQAFYLSLTEYNLLSAPRFVGVANYVQLFSDKRFLNSVVITIIFVVGSTVPTVILALGLAMGLNALPPSRLRTFLRGAYYLPATLSLVVVAVVWKLIFQPYGLSYTFTEMIRPEPYPWLMQGSWALAAVIIARIWRTLGYYMVFYLAGLQGISPELLEAATVDGAGSWDRFRHIIWPLLRPVTLMVIVISVMNALRDFSVPYVMTGGGPASGTETLSILMYLTAFSYLRMGSASAIAVLLFLGIVIFTVVQSRVLQSDT